MDAAEQRRLRREARQAKILASKGSRMQQVSGGMADAETDGAPPDGAQLIEPEQVTSTGVPLADSSDMDTASTAKEQQAAQSEAEKRIQKDREAAQAMINSLEAEEGAQSSTNTTNPPDLLNAMQNGMNSPEDMQAFLNALQMGGQMGGDANGLPSGMFFGAGNAGAGGDGATGAARATRRPGAAGTKQAPQSAGLESLFQFSSSASEFMNRGKKAAPAPIRRTLYIHILFAIGLAAMFLYTVFNLPRGEEDDTHIWSLHRLLFEGSMEDLGGVSEWLTVPFQLFVLNESVILTLDKLQQPRNEPNPNEMHLLKIFKFLSGVYGVFSTMVQDLAVFCGVFLCVMMSPLVVARISALFGPGADIESS